MALARRLGPAPPPPPPPAVAAVLLLLVVSAGAGVGSAAAAKLDPKGVKITLQAKWDGTPLLHEAAEFMADEDPALFWKFVEDWQRRSADVGAGSEQCWAGIQATAAAHLTPNMARLFGASLAARQYSARLEMFSQLAEDSRAAAAGGGSGGAACCWVLLGGKAYTDAAELANALAVATTAGGGYRTGAGSGTGAVYPFDHIYSNPDLASPPVNITGPNTLPVELFAPIGSHCGARLHTILSHAVMRADLAATADSGRVRLAYAWRPLMDAEACGSREVHACNSLGTEGRLVLPGYGVELALKNMEYNAQDDSKKGASEGDKGEEEAGEEEAGEEGQEEEEEVAVPGPASTSDDGVLKVKLKSLGLQAAQRILNAAAAAANSSSEAQEQDPLQALQEIAQDFPRLVEQLSQQRYGKSLRTAVGALQRYIPHGSQFFLLNGLMYDTQDFNLYDFLDVVRREVRLHDALSAAGLPPTQLRQALLLRGAGAANDEPPRLYLKADDFIAWVNNLEKDDRYASWPSDLNQLLMPMYPGRLPTIGRNVLTAIYVFDPATPAALEIAALAHQMYLQGFPVRIGLLPVVPRRVQHVKGAAGALKSDQEPSHSERMGRLLATISRTFGAATAANFFYELRTYLPPAEDEQPGFEARVWDVARGTLAERWEVWGSSQLTADEVIALATAPGRGDPHVYSFLEGAAELAYSTGLAGQAKSGVLVFNGVVSANEAGSWRATTMSALQAQMQVVQEDIYMQRISNAAKDVYEAILTLHGSIPRYNPRIMPLDGPGYIRISGETEEYRARQLALTGPRLGLAALTPGPRGLYVRYFGPEPSLVEPEEGAPTPAPLAPVTHWVVANVAGKQGLQLVAAALQHRSAAGRVAIVVNSIAASPRQEGGSFYEHLMPIEMVMVAVSSGLFDSDPLSFAETLDAILQQPAVPGALSLGQLDELMGFNGRLEAALHGLYGGLPAAAASQARFARSALGVPAGASVVLTNGRLVELPLMDGAGRTAAAANGTDGGGGVGEEDEVLSTQDFELLELYAQRHQYSGEVEQLVREAEQAGTLASSDLSTVAAVISSALAASKPEEVDQRSGRISELIARQATQRTFMAIPPKQGAPEAAPLLVQAVLNPLSKPAQRLAPLLSFLRGVLDVDLQLLLNPQPEYEDMPLKTFYRYALPAADASGLPQPAAATFTGLPPNKVLTLGMDEPEPWLVEPVRAEADLDNLRLEELGEGQGGMEAVFELEALMLTGMCLDLTSLAARLRDQMHPRGVQLQLLSQSAAEDAAPLVDTLVMSNLGYFQLKSRPGLWKLKLAPGRSQELYTVASSTGASISGQQAEAAVAGADARQVPVAISSFTGKHMHLFLRKDPARMQDDVLEDSNSTEADGGKSLWDKVTSLSSAWTGGGGEGGKAGVSAKATGGGEGDRETIHVFTVASGHMYERLQKIMILSVIKRTPARVKFWFIKNYMSPQMKAFVPFMAQKYDFDYEFVTYKWPSWLHKQTEKQRIIWAYKILFLDVLFPLGLKKVIFCDSDQVVRADMLELWHMDLQGAPYGYTPFCDNTEDMEGFKFWKQGFWKDHLQGKPYHISALYVVDLERFREMAAGDRLRVIYDGLSKDPNSLANLDQDLPNYAQHGVPIFSLPGEWLWCETWCGSKTRPQAKTIDLCNNPLTKEPKLQGARRIIAEWPDLNREAEEFTAAVGRVQRGEWSQAELLADASAFHVRLTPMVEGSTWTSAAPDAAAAAPAAADDSSSSGGGDDDSAGEQGAGHDATEL